MGTNAAGDARNLTRLRLTSASTQAGFASTSDFSDAFHRMSGLTATTLIKMGPTITDADRRADVAAPDDPQSDQPVVPAG